MAARSQGEKEESSSSPLASSSSTCLLVTPSIYERGERRREETFFSRISFSPASFVQNSLGFNSTSDLFLQRIRRRCDTVLSSLRDLLLFLFSPSSFVGLLLHFLPSTPFEGIATSRLSPFSSSSCLPCDSREG